MKHTEAGNPPTPNELVELVRGAFDVHDSSDPGPLALDELLARLSAAEQERDQEARKADFWKATATKTTVAAHAAEARAEAAEQALHEIAAADGSNDPTWWGSSPEHLRSIARAALAGREETT